MPKKNESLLESIIEDSLVFLNDLKWEEYKFYNLFLSKLKKSTDGKNYLKGKTSYLFSVFPRRRKIKTKKEKAAKPPVLDILLSSFSEAFLGSSSEISKAIIYQVLVLYGVDTDKIVDAVEQHISNYSSLFYSNIKTLLRDELSDFFFDQEAALLSYHIDEVISNKQSNHKNFFERLKDAVSKRLKSQYDFSPSIKSWEEVVDGIIDIVYSKYFQLTKTG